VLVGAYLIWRAGWPVVVVGVLSIASGVLYTVGRYSLAYLGIADLFVLVFFGPVAVGGTYYVQALSITVEVLVAGLGPGLLSVAILLVNNIRDIDEDRAAGKRTLVVRLGRRVGVVLYAACIVGAAFVPAALVLWTGCHWGTLLALVVLPLAWSTVRRLRTQTDADGLNPLLGATARLLLVYSMLFSVGWLL
jgi:1,4-dihydroxy-2-naphthoate octaprenyltransferase